MPKSALAITEDHAHLADAAVGHLQRVNCRASARATLDGGASHSSDIWSANAALGWNGLALDEAFGGSGFGLAELAVVLESQGRQLCPGPFLPTVAASVLIDRYSCESVRAHLIPGLADGSTVGALGVTGTATVGVEAISTGDFPAVLGAPDADVIVLVVGDDLIIVDARTDGVTVDRSAALDSTRSLGSVRLRDVAVPADHVLKGVASQARTVFRILAAAEAVGISWATLEMAVEYTKVREQFGRTIGTFQAVKHHATNMLMNAEQVTAAVWDAARTEDLADGAFASAVAAVNARRALIANAQTNLQLHGGIGYTWEHDGHLYLRRARTLATVLADARDPVLDVVGAVRRGEAHGASFALPPEAEKYRQEASEVADRVKAAPPEKQREIRAETGYLVPHWPKPWGRAADVLEQLIIDEEFEGLPQWDLSISGWVMLTIAQAGSAEQAQRWVGPVLRGEAQWCQLFSEPGAGSDAASVRTAGRKVEGGWRVSGQKVWTSFAQHCQWGLATVRTDPKAAKHAGVTMMAINMKAAGVRINPLRDITGAEHFNEVFLDDVFVPDADVVGGVNEGWRVARATLGNERISIGGGAGNTAKPTIDELVDLLDSAPEATAATYMRQFGEVVADVHTTRLLNLRQVSRAMAGAEPGPEGNVTKLLGAEVQQRLSRLAMDLAGPAAVSGDRDDLSTAYLADTASTIAGGTSEISRNTIAERILGLPRDPLMR
ncbi:acyl-CoA dehydrogenase [Nocardia gamkensis]|uniref:acyl-CoA dehydrogenase n=1 Tax=Nocardia gamkensis TaxID=352869 RepID=UPI0036EFCABA